jgi:hypothetical protein
VTQWLLQQWNDIRGHAKWAVVLVILGAIVTAAIALTHGLALWQQLTLAVLFIVMFGWAVLMTAAARLNLKPSSAPERQMHPVETFTQVATLSHNETLQLSRAVSELSNLTWAQETALCLIYLQTPLHQAAWKLQFENLGFANVLEQIFEPLKKTTLIAYDMQNVRMGPSNNAIIARHVEVWAQSLTRI